MKRRTKTTPLRYAGNVLLLIGYFTLLHIDVKTGVVLNLIGGLLTIPFAVEQQLWDLLITCIFFTAVEVAKLSGA